MKLNIGCEACVLPTDEWVNYDRIKVHPDVLQHDVRNGIPMPKNSVDVIYGGNFFDHLSYYEGIALLRECRRVLKDNGKIYFSVMDTDTIINAYLMHRMEQYTGIQPEIFGHFSNATKFATFLLGNLALGGEYTGHKMLFTPQSISEMFWEVGITAHCITPDFREQPWCAENPLYRTSNLYVEGTK